MIGGTPCGPWNVQCGAQLRLPCRQWQADSNSHRPGRRRRRRRRKEDDHLNLRFRCLKTRAGRRCRQRPQQPPPLAVGDANVRGGAPPDRGGTTAYRRRLRRRAVDSARIGGFDERRGSEGPALRRSPLLPPRRGIFRLPIDGGDGGVRSGRGRLSVHRHRSGRFDRA